MKKNYGFGGGSKKYIKKIVIANYNKFKLNNSFNIL